MIEMTDEKKNERLKLFCEEKTYTYIKDSLDYFFNGYIILLEEDKVYFNDDKLGTIPILIKDIMEVTYSNRKKGDEEWKNQQKSN